MERKRLLIASGVAMGLSVGLAGQVLADDVDDAIRMLMDLDQRVHTLAMEFRDAPPPAADLADRRVIDATVLFNLKNYDEAATLLIDVVEKWPSSPAYKDAIYLLGESLFQLRDYLSSRRYYEQAIASVPDSKKAQEGLQRLVEIALRTGDYEHVDEHLAQLDKIPPQYLDPSVPYVRAKYYFFRDKLDYAYDGFSAVPASSPYYFQARYFAATVQVKKGDLAAASTSYDALLKMQAPDEGSRDIQDLARMAVGRILYERGQFDRAIDAYLLVPNQSRYFTDALYEVAWTYVRSKEHQKAYRAFDLLLLQNPDSTQAPELKLIMGNLNLRQRNFYLASDAFSKTRDEFEPIHRRLQLVIAKSQTDPKFFDSLIGTNLDKFDVSVFVPAAAAKWVKAEPDVAKMLSLAGDMVEVQRALKDTDSLLGRLERAVSSTAKAGLFRDLASARTKSIEILNQLVDVRDRSTARMREIFKSRLGADEAKELDRIAAERNQLQRQLGTLPLTENALKAREKKTVGQFTAVEGLVSELNVEIQGMEAQFVAIQQYFANSREEQKIKPEDLQAHYAKMRAELDELHAVHDKLRDELAEGQREAGAAGVAVESERSAAQQLAELLKREEEIYSKVRGRLGREDQGRADRYLGVLARAEQVQEKLADLDKRIDAQAELRLASIKDQLNTERGDLTKVGQRLDVVLNESQSLGGGLAQAVFARVADRFYDLVVRSDVGIIDVAWGLKDQKSEQVSKLVNQQKLELKAVDDDFRRVLQEDK